MKNFIKIFLLMCLSFITLNAVPQINDFSPKGLAKIIAGELSKSLPKQLNYMTTLRSVKSEEHKLYFLGVLSEDAYDAKNPHLRSLKSLDKEEKEIFKKNLIKGIQYDQIQELCTDATTRTILESGIEFVYVYYFEKQSTYIGETNVNVNICRTLKI